MKKYSIIVFIVGLLAGVNACKKYETFPIDQVAINRVFDPRDSNGVNAQAFLNTTYNYLLNGHDRIDGTDYLDNASDDAVSSAAANLNTATLLSTSSYNSGTFGAGIGTSTDNVWGQYYAGIRQATIFINNVMVVPFQDTVNNIPGNELRKSEARFLRAFFYFELVKRYGGVPLLGNKVYNINDNLALPRNSFADCINFIVSECDAIKDSVMTTPLTNTNNYGRATKGAVLALKAKALLYAASPLFNGGNIDPGNPLTGYVGAADPNRWKLAADAANDVINLGTYGLDAAGFRDVFLTQNNREIIFIRQGDNGTNVETHNAPIGFPAATATGNSSPTQDLVDAFPMANGLSIHTPGSGYDPNNPYTGRDPRLSYTVFYNGYTWLNTPLAMYEGGQSKPNNGKQQTLTGYYLHKFMGNSENTTTFTAHSEDWIIFRYAEILLDYVEATNEYSGPSPDLYAKLGLLRARAGIPAGSGSAPYGLTNTSNKDEFRTIVQNERRIEMAFEEQRFFDIRRWKIAGDGAAVMNQPKGSVTITNSFGTLTYSYGNVNERIFPTNTFKTKDYLYPIPYDEVVKNPNMKQNPGWN